MDSRNATASWSGYSHQGKVGIFLALKEILNIMKSPKVDFNNWKLEYESAEDIDIKFGSKVVTRHQVKAYKDGRTLKKYEDVLNIQEYKLVNGQLTLVKKGFQIRSWDKLGNALDIEVDEDSRYLHTICKIQGFYLPQEEYEQLPNKPTYIPNPNKIKLYVYPDGEEFCDISNGDTCKDYCVALIGDILRLSNHCFKDDALQKEYRFYELLAMLDNEIRIKHNSSGYPCLSFSEISNVILATEKHTEQNIKLVRSIFIRKWEEFIGDLDYSDLQFEEKHLAFVEKKMEEIFRLSDNDFVQFMYDINPDKNILTFATLQGITELAKWDDLKCMFFECLLEVAKEEFIVDQRGYTRDGGYLLTLITGSKSSASRIINTIISNTNIAESVFEKKYLVNREIDGIEFENYISSLPEDKDFYFEIKSNWSKLKEKTKFYSPEMSFITYLKAKEKLGGDN